MKRKESTIGDDDDDIRLDRWFKRHHPGFPHALLEKNTRKGLIKLDGKKVKTSERVHAGQSLSYPDIAIAELPKKKRVATQEELAEIKKWVLYKDDNIIIVNKPFGLAVQGGSNIGKNLDDMLDGLTFEKSGRPKLVHRLDRDTSGVLALARTSKAAHVLMKFFSHRRIDKIYWALVNGAPVASEGKIDLTLAKKADPKASGKPGGPEGRDYEIMQVDEDGQKAVTAYRVVDQLARKFAFMELRPLTGRTHQLRVHMQAIGCPIVGDHKYGGSMDDAKQIGVENVLHLHARRIMIPAFEGGPDIDVVAPLPSHMKRSFEALGIDIPKQ